MSILIIQEHFDVVGWSMVDKLEDGSELRLVVTRGKEWSAVASTTVRSLHAVWSGLETWNKKQGGAISILKLT